MSSPLVRSIFALAWQVTKVTDFTSEESLEFATLLQQAYPSKEFKDITLSEFRVVLDKFLTDDRT